MPSTAAKTSSTVVLMASGPRRRATFPSPQGRHSSGSGTPKMAMVGTPTALAVWTGPPSVVMKRLQAAWTAAKRFRVEVG
jgi:hypothetical protein